MGISGFWPFFSILNDYELLKTRVKRGSKLLIDGDGFMFYTMENLLTTESDIIIMILLLVLKNVNVDINKYDECIKNIVKQFRYKRENKINDAVDENLQRLNELKNIL